MNKQLRLISTLAFGMAILSISSLANAEIIVNVKEVALVAKGAGVHVSAEITCNPIFSDSFIMISGNVNQRTGNSTTDASLSGGGLWSCTGSPQDLDFVAPVTSPRKPFKPGQALMSFFVSLFTNGTGQSDSGIFVQEIRIRN